MARDVVIDIKAQTGQYERQLSQATRKTEGLSASLGRIGHKAALGGIAAAAVGVAALGAAVLKVGTASVTAFTAFEKSLSQIEGLVGVAHDEVMGFADAVKDMAIETARPAQELADALFFITSAGLEGQVALDALEVSAKAAASGLGETTIIADVVTSAMNAYGPATLSASMSTDVLVAAVREGKAAAPELASSLGRVIPIASQMGVRFDEVGAAVAAMTRTGLNAAEASTALRSILNSLLAPTGDATKALDEMGLSAGGLRQEIKDRGLFATLEHLNTAFAGQDDQTVRVFGNVRALTGVMSLMGSNAEATRGIFDELANATGSLDAAFGVAADTGAFAFEQAKVRINNALLEVGEQIVPMLADSLESIGPLLPELIAGLGDLATAAVNLGVDALPVVVGALGAVEEAMLNFQIGQIEARKNIEGFIDVADRMLGPWINLENEYGDVAASQQQFLLAQRAVGRALADGADPMTVAANTLALLGESGDLTADRLEVLQRRLGLTDTDMAAAGESALSLASDMGTSRVEMLIMEEALSGVRGAAYEAGKEIAISAAAHEILGLAAYGTADAAARLASTLDTELSPALSTYQSLLTDAYDAQLSLAEAMKMASDPAFKAVKSVQALSKAEKDLTDLRAKTGDDAATAQELADAQIKVVEATLAAQSALDGVSGMALEAALDAVSQALGISEDEARDLLETLGLLDGKEVNTVINVTTKEQRIVTQARYDKLERYALGGTVPGPIGAPRLAVVHGGEEVLTPQQQKQPSVTYNQSAGSRSVSVTIVRPETNDLQGDIAAGLTRAGIVEQMDAIGGY